MADTQGVKGKLDGKPINLNNPEELHLWAMHFNVSDDALREMSLR